LRASNDDNLIENLNNLTKTHGSAIFQAIFHIFASLELSPRMAEEYWREVLLHRHDMGKTLGRSIDLLPAMYDYLVHSNHPLLNPRLIEESSYAKVIMETTHDGLTTLFNRHYFDEVLEQSVSAAQRYNTDITLLFLDLDNFKDINDNYGHKAGDAILQQVALVIHEQKRDSDIAARYGGEEFVLLMPHTSSLNAFILAERIRKKVALIKVASGTMDVKVTVSGGIASFPQNSRSSSELLHRADSALYLAKGAGKNTISMFKEEKRRYLRVRYEESVKIKELGFDTSPIFSGTSKDICIGGILFENSEPLSIGSRIQVSIPIQGSDSVLLIGTVVRVEAFSENQYDIGMAISFKEMEKIANKEIANFLQSSGSKKL